MYDYKFRFADEESVNEFCEILDDEELWFHVYKDESAVVVDSIFESTAEYLYRLIDERGLRML